MITYQAVDQKNPQEHACEHILTDQLHTPLAGIKPFGLYREALECREQGWCSLTHVWIAWDGNKRVGVGCLRQGAVTSINVYVKPEYRRRGIGSHLLQLGLAVCPQAQGAPTEEGTPFYLKHDVKLIA